MSFFGPPKGHGGFHNPQNKMFGVVKPHSAGTTGAAGTASKSSKTGKSETTKSETNEGTSGDAKGEGVEKKGSDKEAEAEAEPETETEINTRLNALLYHTSDDTIDLYKRQNNSSDLLGRLYYDDYDSDSVSDGGSAQISPVASAQGSLADYFTGARFNTASISELIAGGYSESPSLTPVVSPAFSSPHVAPPAGTTNSTLKLSSGESTPSFGIGSRSPSASRIRPAVQRLASFERGVSFDSLNDDHRRSLTFKVKHPHFKFRRNNKTYLTGYNGDMESIKSIEWLFDEMVVNGDTIIVLQVLDEKSYTSIDKRRANESLRRIELLNKHVKKVSLVFEVVVGKPLKLLQSAIDEYNPQMMSIGTHNYEDKEGKLHEHHTHKSFLSKSSMSKHFLECALVPVIVVKPFYEHVELLRKPVDSENYFANWIAESDIAWTYSKDKNARKKRITSPLSSKNNSSTNLAAIESRGRRSNNSHSNLPFLAQAEKTSEGLRAVKSHVPESRGRATEDHENPLLLAVRSSESRSRSSSRSRTGLRKLFGHHH